MRKNSTLHFSKCKAEKVVEKDFSRVFLSSFSSKSYSVLHLKELYAKIFPRFCFYREYEFEDDMFCHSGLVPESSKEHGFLHTQE